MIRSGQKITGAGRHDGAHELVAVTLKNLVDLSGLAAGLTLHYPTIRAALSGGYISRFKGRGMEFDETRLYQPGDDIRNIDWRVTARTGKAHTKIFREERERPVFISIDDRLAMHFATRGVFKSVLAAKLAGLLAWACEYHGDRIGGQIFSEHGCLELKPRSGKQGVLRLFNALVRPAEDTLLSAFSLDHVLSRLTQHARPGSLVYIISDFRGVNAASETHLAKLSQHCDIVLIFVYDVLERHLPEKGRYRFTDSVRDVIIDARDERRLSLYRERFETRLQSIRQIARKLDLSFLMCSTTDDPVQCLRFPGNSQAQRSRQRQR
ncbi:MAG: DUF58 domain-containing protein [Gammaproteobacteria bacterium]